LQAVGTLSCSDGESPQSLKALPEDIKVSDGIKFALKALAK